MGGSGVRNLKSVEKFEITVLEGGRELTQKAGSSETSGGAEDIGFSWRLSLMWWSFLPQDSGAWVWAGRSQMVGFRKG